MLNEDLYFKDDLMVEIISHIRNKFPDCAITISIGEKEKETYKNKKRISSYFYRNIKNKDSLGSNKVSNSIRNSLIFGKNDGNKNKEKMNNIKNEFSQVEESNNNYANDYLNIMQKNKKIDKLAKKLSLKLNEDEYYGRNKTINNCGANNIIFKNGFFNGTNIIMNPEDLK